MPPKGTAKCKLPVPLPEGYIVKNLERKEWRLGKIIGKGGFGLIYLASPHVGRPVEDDAAKHVIKVEYLENGPLFSELKFYQRAAKQENIKRWIEKKDLHYLGIPEYWGTGAAEYKGKSYRFMVMDRLGVDLQNILTHRKILPKGTVMHVGSQVLEVLEYMHENEYVHGDIKAANLMLGFKNPDEVYLADYGLSYRYCPDGTHKPYKPNPKKGHNGTIQFTSVDAHMGAAPSRRGDLQILCFCMLQWLCGKLPWEQNLKDPSAVQSAKTKLLEELPESVMKLATEDITREIAKFLTCINKLGYHEKPNYKDLKRILLSGMNSSGTACYASLNLSTAGCNSSKNAKVEPPELIKPSSKPVKPLNQNKEHGKEANMKMNGSYVKCRDVQESKPSRLNKVHCKNETSKEQTNRRSAPLYPGTSFLEHEDDEYENSNAYSYTCLQQKTRGDVTDSFDHSSILVPAFSDKAKGEIYRYVVAIVVLLIAIIISLYCL